MSQILHRTILILKKLLVVYRKFRFNGVSCLLPDNYKQNPLYSSAPHEPSSMSALTAREGQGCPRQGRELQNTEVFVLRTCSVQQRIYCRGHNRRLVWSLKPAPSGSYTGPHPLPPQDVHSSNSVQSFPSAFSQIPSLPPSPILVHFLNKFIWGTTATSSLGFLFLVLILRVYHPHWNQGDPAFFGKSRLPLMTIIIHVDRRNIRKFHRNKEEDPIFPGYLSTQSLCQVLIFSTLKSQTPRLSSWDTWDLALPASPIPTWYSWAWISTPATQQSSLSLHNKPCSLSRSLQSLFLFLSGCGFYYILASSYVSFRMQFQCHWT